MEPASKTEISYKLVNDETFETEISIYVYTEKSIAMTCTEHFGKSFSENLKMINGKYNAKLKIGKGWIFSNDKYPALQNLVSDIMTFKIKGVVPFEAKKVDIYEISGPLGQLHMENPMVSEFKKFMNKLSDVKTKTVYKSGDKIYIFGPKEDVETCMTEMGKNEANIIHTLISNDVKFVVVN
jgi:hypothetical protein